MDQLLIQQKLLNGLGFTQSSSPMKPCLTQVRNIEVDQFCLESFTEFMSTSDNTPSGHGIGCVALGIRFVRQPCNTTTLPLNKQTKKFPKEFIIPTPHPEGISLSAIPYVFLFEISFCCLINCLFLRREQL